MKDALPPTCKPMGLSPRTINNISDILGEKRSFEWFVSTESEIL